MFKLLKEKKVITTTEWINLVIRFIIGTLLYLFVPYFNRILIDYANSTDKKNMNIENFFIIILATFLIQGFLFYCVTYYSKKKSTEVSKRLKTMIFNKAIEMNKSDYNDENQSKILNLILSDSGNVSSTIINYKTHIIASVFQIIIVVFIMFYIDISLGLVSVIFIPVYMLSMKLNVNKIANANKAYIENTDKYISTIKNSLHNKIGINLFKAEAVFKSQHDKDVRQWEQSLKEYNFWFMLKNRIPTLISILAPLFILWVGARKVRDLTISIGTLIMFSQYMILLFEPLSNLSQTVNEKKAFQPLFERVEEFIYKLSDSEQDYNNIFYEAEEFLFIKNSSVLNYKYEPLYYIKEMKIPQKGLFILKGANGSGKTTLMNIIGGVFRPDLIKKENEDSCFKISEKFKNKITYFKHPLFFLNGTIEENILLGKTYPKDLIIDLTKLFILPSLNKEIKLDPINLSSGEQQKISLIRAFLQEGKVLVLDEPTANLEKEAIESLYLYINKLKRDKLIIIISHDEVFDEISDSIFRIKENLIIKE